MKKIFSGIVALTVLLTVFMLPAHAAAKTIFSDNFSSANLANKWINPALDSDDKTEDKECEGVPVVKDGVLQLENVKRFGSTPKFYQGDTSGWHTWRIEVKGTNFKSYLDGQLLGEWEYKKNQTTGYISLNCCIFDGAVDDFTITEYEAMPAQPKPPVTTSSKPAPSTSSQKPVASTSSKQPTASSTEVSSTTSTTEEPSSTPDTDQTESKEETPATGALIKTKYKDITIDNTFHSVTMDISLNVKDMLDSFNVTDEYTIRLVTADGKVVEDQQATVADTMKLQILEGSEVAAEYTLNINAKEAVKDKAGFPVWAIVLIVIGGVIVVAAVVLVVLIKTGVIKLKRNKQ